MNKDKGATDDPFMRPPVYLICIVRGGASAGRQGDEGNGQVEGRWVGFRACAHCYLHVWGMSQGTGSGERDLLHTHTQTRTYVYTHVHSVTHKRHRCVDFYHQ